MAKGGEKSQSHMNNHHHQSNNRSSRKPLRVSNGLQITSVDPIGDEVTPLEDEDEDIEEETSCFTTSQSVVITRCPGGGGGTKHIEREIVEQKATKVNNALQTCEVGDLIQGRTREKFELQRLNDRLSSFIERVRWQQALLFIILVVLSLTLQIPVIFLLPRVTFTGDVLLLNWLILHYQNRSNLKY